MAAEDRVDDLGLHGAESCIVPVFFKYIGRRGVDIAVGTVLVVFVYAEVVVPVGDVVAHIPSPSRICLTKSCRGEEAFWWLFSSIV